MQHYNSRRWFGDLPRDLASPCVSPCTPGRFLVTSEFIPFPEVVLGGRIWIFEMKDDELLFFLYCYFNLFLRSHKLGCFQKYVIGISVLHAYSMPTVTGSMPCQLLCYLYTWFHSSNTAGFDTSRQKIQKIQKILGLIKLAANHLVRPSCTLLSNYDVKHMNRFCLMGMYKNQHTVLSFRPRWDAWIQCYVV